MANHASHLSPEEHRLSNGLPVILQDWDSPVATTYWWNQVGSLDEMPAEYGFAHFLEHMLFKDAAAKETGVPSSGQLAQMVESLGGDINAYTSFDQTVYHVTGTEQHWEKWVDGLGGMAKPQRFLNADFQREREVILEELRRSLDSPSRQMYQALFEMNYGKHPYGRPVIGFEKVLKQATCAKLENFYKRMYTPSRMGLILVGPIGKSTARKKALLSICEKRFGSHHLPRTNASVGAVRSVPGGESKRRDGIISRTVDFDVQAPSLAFAWQAPGLKDPRMVELDMAFDTLCMGELSRLYQKLFYETSTVTDVGGGVFAPSGHGPGMAYLQLDAEVMPKLSDAARLAKAEMERLIANGPTQEELDRIRVNAESEKLYATQTVDGIASRIGHSRFVVEDMAFDAAYLDRVRSTRPKDIQRALQETCVGETMSMLYFVPKKDSKKNKEAAHESLKAFEDVWARPSATKPKAPLLKKPLTGARVDNLPGGNTFILSEKKDSNTFSIHLSMLGGARLESLQKHGASHLMAMVWPKGTSKLDSKGIAREIEGRAASVEGFSGRNSMGLELNGLARDFDALSGIFEEILFDPTFPSADMEHARRVVEDSLRAIEDHSSSLCSKHFYETLYGGHPYGRLVSGTLESVKGLHKEDLQNWHKSQVLQRPWVISIAGAISKEDADRVVSRWMQRRTQKSGSMPEATSIPEPKLPAPRWIEKKMGREQAHVIVGGLGYRVNDSDRMVGRILSNLLGGQSGRLFLELREKKSLAYTVSPVQTEGLERGSFGTYIGCAPSKVDVAIAGIKHVLETLAKKGPTAKEMKRAQEFYLGRRAMDLQGDSAVAASLGLEQLYGLPLQTEAQCATLVRKVTAKQVQHACAKLLCEAPQVTSAIL